MSKNIPGYTGFRPGQNFSELPNNNSSDNGEVKRHQIPGYNGFVPGIKSENVYGSTYGRTSKASMGDKIVRGTDPAADIRYVSSNQDNFTNQKELFNSRKQEEVNL